MGIELSRHLDKPDVTAPDWDNVTDTTITIDTQDGYQYILADREAPSENWPDSVTGNKDGTPSLA